MPQYTRRRILHDMGVASAVGAVSLLTPGCKEKVKAAVPQDLYLIFPGSWLFSFEKGGISAFTTHFSDHTYDFGISPPKSQNRVSIEKGQTYTVEVSGNDPAPPSQTLVADMVKAQQGPIFKSVTCNSLATPGLRRIKLPMPNKIHPAALLKGVIFSIDPNVSQVLNVNQWPAAFAFIYSGDWTSMSVSHGSQKIFTVSPDQHAHVSFRVCQTSKCDQTSGCGPTTCKELEADVAHAQCVFTSLMALLHFPDGVSQPTIGFLPCVPGTGDIGVTIDPGADGNIQPSEIGMKGLEDRCKRFGHLHNCAASAGIVGA
jgi:hypothetical protein